MSMLVDRTCDDRVIATRETSLRESGRFLERPTFTYKRTATPSHHRSFAEESSKSALL